MTTFYRRHGKRVLDLALTIPALVLLAPVIGLVALVVRWRLGAPVLFRQVRPGLHGRPFTIYKFRTMTDARDVDGDLLPDAQRITRLGCLLRSTSLDEFPELWNVLRGDMSLVGPRPLLMEYLPCYTPEERSRHFVRPGITGLAQVHGRNHLAWDDRLAMDVQYVRSLGPVLDLKILFLTVVRVALGRDIIVIPSAKQERLDAYREQDQERTP